LTEKLKSVHVREIVSAEDAEHIKLLLDLTVYIFAGVVLEKQLNKLDLKNTIRGKKKNVTRSTGR